MIVTESLPSIRMMKKQNKMSVTPILVSFKLQCAVVMLCNSDTEADSPSTAVTLITITHYKAVCYITKQVDVVLLSIALKIYLSDFVESLNTIYGAFFFHCHH